MMRACVSQRPRLVDMGRVYRQSNLENLEQAFHVAEKDLGVTRLLDPEGKRPKSLCQCLTYARVVMDFRVSHEYQILAMMLCRS